MEGGNYTTVGGEDSLIVVDFYNLHLDCCLKIVPQSNIDIYKFWYKTELPEKVTENIDWDNTQPEWKAKCWVKRGNQYILTQPENIDTEDITYPVFPEQKWADRIAITAINPPSTQTKAKIIEFFRYTPGLTDIIDGDDFGSLKKYHSICGIDWFEGQDFLDFMRDYFCFRKLIDGCCERQIPTWTLEWFGEKIQLYRYSFQLWKDDEIVEMETLDDDISLDSFNPTIHGIYIDQGLPYGLDLAPLFVNIDFQVFHHILKKIEIKRCAYKDCNNIFYVNHGGREYCLGKMCQAKRSSESSTKSDNRTRYTIRNYIVRNIDSSWLAEKKQLSAAELIQKRPNIAKYLSRRKEKDPTKSLALYLKGKLMKELLREKGIKLTITKEQRDHNLYTFERVVVT